RTQVELVRKLLRWVQNAPPSSDCEVCSVSNRPIVRTTISTITPEQDARRPLGLICVGTGRCGTKSITDMIGGLPATQPLGRQKSRGDCNHARPRSRSCARESPSAPQFP